MSRWDAACALAAGLVLTAVVGMLAGGIAAIWACIYALVCVQ